MEKKRRQQPAVAAAAAFLVGLERSIRSIRALPAPL